MGSILRHRALLSLTSGLISIFFWGNVSAEARPSIFVPVESGIAWWARDLTLRPMATKVGKVGVAEINAHLAARSAVTTQKVCFVESVSPGDIVSADRATQQEIDTTLQENPQAFAAIYTSRQGRAFNVRVVTYQLCDAPGGATGLLITNADGSLHTFAGQEFVFTRIFKRADGKINVFGCFECGDVSELLYDSENDRFYNQWIGH